MKGEIIRYLLQARLYHLDGRRDIALAYVKVSKSPVSIHIFWLLIDSSLEAFHRLIRCIICYLHRTEQHQRLSIGWIFLQNVLEKSDGPIWFFRDQIFAHQRS